MRSLHCLTGWSVSVTILPGISAFVGADIVAGIYALEMDRKKNALLLDIGTNGEMAAGGGGWISCDFRSGGTGL